jgi:hypothetical protein
MTTMIVLDPGQIERNLPLPTSEPTASAWRRLRLANRGDEAEFQRLFGMMAAEQGIEGHNEHKVLKQFDRAVRRDRAALVVADKFGQLGGMVMCGYVYPWYVSDALMAVLSVFIDPGHRETPAARALVKFSAQPLNQLESSLDGLASGGAC